MSRQPSGQQNEQRQPIVNGNTAWTLESVLSPPTTARSDAGAQQLAGAIGQDAQKVREAIPLLRDPRYHIASITQDPDRRRVTVHVRTSADPISASDSSTASQRQQRQSTPRTEYTFYLTLSDDRRQISKVDMSINTDR